MSNWGLGRQDESQIQPKLDRQPGQGTSPKGQGLRASIAVETEMLITGRSLAALVLLREHAGTCIPLSRYGHEVTNPESVRGAGECSFLAPMDISGRESTWPSLAVWFELESTDTELRKHKRRIGIQHKSGRRGKRVVESGEWSPQRDRRRAVSSRMAGMETSPWRWKFGHCHSLP